MIKSPQRHLAAISGGGQRRRYSVDGPSDSYRSSLLLTDPTCLCIFQTKKYKFRFFSVSFTTTFFSRFPRPIFVRKIRLKSVNHIYRYFRTDVSLVIKTTKKDGEELTIRLYEYVILNPSKCLFHYFHKVTNINIAGCCAICVQHITRQTWDIQFRHLMTCWLEQVISSLIVIH